MVTNFLVSFLVSVNFTHGYDFKRSVKLNHLNQLVISAVRFGVDFALLSGVVVHWFSAANII